MSAASRLRRTQSGSPDPLCTIRSLSTLKSLLIISVPLFLMLSCKSSETGIGDSYVEKDPSEKNEIIESAHQRGEEWVQDPLLLVHKLFRPDYLISTKNTYKAELTLDSADNYTVTILQEGYLDQPLYGIKSLVQLKWHDWHWKIISMKEGYKCGGPRTYYSADRCAEGPEMEIEVIDSGHFDSVEVIFDSL